MQNRFQKIKEMGSKGKKCNPLLLEEFQWESEWVDENSETVHGDGDSLTWTAVDEVAGATQDLRGRHLPRAAAARAATAVKQTYARNRKRPRNTPAQDNVDADTNDSDVGDETQDEPEDSDSATAMEEDEEAGDGHFQLDDDLLN